MNYLAHIFLSGDDGLVQLGNFIGDAVKGAAYKDFPPPVAAGILLHRAIDDFTDRHPKVKEAVHQLKPYFGRYSAILVDIYFDYLLASRFREFSDVPLRTFAWRFYRTMIRHRRLLPSRIKRFMWHFICTDRLARYSKPEGIRDSLSIMVSVRNLRIGVDTAVDYMLVHEQELRSVFTPFFAELRSFCEGYIASGDRAGYLRAHRG